MLGLYPQFAGHGQHPVPGRVGRAGCDAGQQRIYLVEGRYINAASSAAAALPWKKIGNTVVKFAKDKVATRVGRVADTADDVVGKAGEGTGKSETVWDSIKATQQSIEGTTIPKSFELSVNDKKYWINPNATKHMAEYSTRTLSHGQKLTEQQLLTSLKKAIGDAAEKGYTYNIPIRVGNWELIFSPPRQAGQLPVVKHALFRP